MSPDDIAQIDAAIAAFYAAFDNRDGRTPAAEALRGLFTAGATITRVAGGTADSWSADAFIAPRIELLTDGRLTDFHERETEARTRVWRNIASRWSRYAKQGRLEGRPYGGAGDKLFQLLRTPQGWRIGAVLWEDDEPL